MAYDPDDISDSYTYHRNDALFARIRAWFVRQKVPESVKPPDDKKPSSSTKESKTPELSS